MADNLEDSIFKAIRITNPYEGMSQSEILIAKEIAKNETEANEIIAGAAPIIEGFSNSHDIQIEDSQIREILSKNFPPEIMRFVRIGRVTKSALFSIQFPQEISRENLPDYITWNDYSRVGRSPERFDEFYEWVSQRTNISRDEFYRKNLLFSAVPVNPDIIKINLYNLGFRENSQEGYFKDMPFLDNNLTDEENLKIYTVALMAHEFTHRLQDNMPEVTELLSIWDTMMKESVQKHITLYAQGYEDGTYSSNRSLSVMEDMADAVMIYLMNPDYLSKDRYELLYLYMPWLEAGSARQILE